jgi:hypothetical protein
MWTDIIASILSIALYLGLFAALPLMIRRQPAARRVAILSLLVAPLVGATIYLLNNRKFSIEGLLFAYPFAMFPLGFWAALIAALTTPLLFYLRDKYGSVTLLFTAGLSGSLIGTVFMFGFIRVAAWIQQPTHPVDLAFFLLCGLTAGMTVGFLAGWVVGRMPSHTAAVT